MKKGLKRIYRAEIARSCAQGWKYCPDEEGIETMKMLWESGAGGLEVLP